MFKLLLVSVCLAGYVTALPGGAPDKACINLTPAHGNFIQENPEGYVIKVDTALNAGEYIVTLSGPDFQGFMLQAFLANGNEPAGTFVVRDPNQARVICQGTAVTHSSSAAGRSVAFEWTGTPGTSVEFRATVAKEYATIYPGITFGPFTV